MPKFYCEYCGIYLTHSSPSGRKQHGKGRKHIQSKVEYYSQFMNESNALKNMNPFMRLDTFPMMGMGMMNPFMNMKPGAMPMMPMINAPGIMPTNITNMPMPGMGNINPNQMQPNMGQPGPGSMMGMPGMGMPGMMQMNPGMGFPNMGFPMGGMPNPSQMNQ